MSNYIRAKVLGSLKEENYNTGLISDTGLIFDTELIFDTGLISDTFKTFSTNRGNAERRLSGINLPSKTTINVITFVQVYLKNIVLR